MRTMIILKLQTSIANLISDSFPMLYYDNLFETYLKKSFANQINVLKNPPKKKLISVLGVIPVK